jgi:uncharacterized protein YegP (UPF0339 family)
MTYLALNGMIYSQRANTIKSISSVSSGGHDEEEDDE